MKRKENRRQRVSRRKREAAAEKRAEKLL